MLEGKGNCCFEAKRGFDLRMEMMIRDDDFDQKLRLSMEEKGSFCYNWHQEVQGCFGIL